MLPTATAGNLRQRAKGIFALAWPIIGAMTSQNLLNLIDTAMVGRLGSSALAAVGLGSMVNWLASAFFMALGSGVQAIAARRTGEKDPKGAINALHGALIVAVAVVLPYSLLLATQADHVFQVLSSDPDVLAGGVPYLQIRLCAALFVVANFAFRGFWNGVGRSTVYLRTILVIHAVNVVLNWVLIYGNLGFSPMGVRGAALASAIAVAVGAVAYTLLAWRHARRDGFLAQGLRGATVRAVLRLSIPSGIQNLFLSGGFVAFYRIAQLLGTQELAVCTVLVNLSMVCLLPSLGFGLAAATMVSAALGRGEPRDAARWAWTAVLLASATMVVLGGILAMAPSTWLSALINDPVAVAMGVAPLIILGLMQPFDAVGLVLSHSLIGAGAVRSVMVGSVVLQWLLFLPVAFIWGVRFGGGLLALWIALAVWRTLYGATMAGLFARGAWVHIRI